jgi:hypothetical protein
MLARHHNLNFLPRYSEYLMEPHHFELDQFGYVLDSYGQLQFEFPVTTPLPDQFPPWTGFGQAISTPAPATYTNSDFPSAEGGSFQLFQESTLTQNVPPPGLNEVLRTQLSSNPALDDQFPYPDLPNHSCVDEEVVTGQGEAHHSNFTSYSASAWDAHRGHIKQLYMHEFKSLEDTMKYMAENHDFRPS